MKVSILNAVKTPSRSWKYRVRCRGSPLKLGAELWPRIGFAGGMSGSGETDLDRTGEGMEGGEDGGERDEEEFEGEGGSAGCRGDSGIGAKTG